MPRKETGRFFRIAKVPAAPSGFIRRPTLAELRSATGLVIGLYVTMRRYYYMPAWEGVQILLGLTIPYLLLVYIVNTRGTRRLKKNIPQPTEMVNHRSSILLFPTVVPCGRNPPPGPPYSKLNCRYFLQDEKVFVHDRSCLDKPERNEIRCGI